MFHETVLTSGNDDDDVIVSTETVIEGNDAFSSLNCRIGGWSMKSARMHSLKKRLHIGLTKREEDGHILKHDELHDLYWCKIESCSHLLATRSLSSVWRSKRERASALHFLQSVQLMWPTTENSGFLALYPFGPYS